MKVIFRVLFLSLVVVCVAGAAEAQEGDLQQDWCAFGPEYCGGGGGGGDPESIACAAANNFVLSHCARCESRCWCTYYQNVRRCGSGWACQSLARSEKDACLAFCATDQCD